MNTFILNELKFSDARSLVKTAQMSARNDETSTYEQWVKYLNDNGFDYIGAGAFSIVYAKEGSNLVVRISDDSAWLKFYEFAYKNQRKNKHLPRIGKIIDASDGYYLVFMERLKSVDLPSHVKMNLGNMIQRTNVKNKHVGRTIEQIKRDLTIDLGSSFMSLFNGLRSSKLRGHYGWDLHSSNIMQRKDGTLVIIDPYADFDNI